MKWVAWIVGGVIGLVALMTGIGLMLPVRHVAAVRVHIRQPAARVFEVASDVAGSTAWRPDLKSIEILSADPLRWRETSGAGAIVMALDESVPPSRRVTRIDDPGQPFGGRWITELTPAAQGTTVTITEEGEVYNPFFRFMSRFVLGHHGMLESYARDLAAHFGESVEPERLERDSS